MPVTEAYCGATVCEVNQVPLTRLCPKAYCVSAAVSSLGAEGADLSITKVIVPAEIKSVYSTCPLASIWLGTRATNVITPAVGRLLA